MAPVLAFALLAAAVLADRANGDLRSRLDDAGVQAVFPGDPTYEQLSAAFNLRFAYLPAAIALPDSAQQVATTVQAGVAENLNVNARGGGHSYTAFAFGGEDGHLLVDLRQLNNVTVEPSTNVATVGAGNLLGDTAIALDSQGSRALPHGTCPYVGIGGHAAYGGFGLTSRGWGLTLDTIQAIDVVLANGTALTVTNSSDPELYFGLRGAAPSFGIVTAYHCQTVPAPSEASIYSVDWDFDADQLAAGLEAWQNFTLNEDLPPQFGGEINLGQGSSQGRIGFSLAAGYFGDNSDPLSVIQPLLNQLPAPTKGPKIQTKGWLDSLQILAGKQALSSKGVNVSANHDTFYTKSLMTPSASPMSSSAISSFAQYLSNQGWQSNTAWFVQVELYGGKNSAITSVPQDATAFDGRDKHFTIQFYASSSNYAPPYPDAGFTFLDGMVQSIVDQESEDWPFGAYANYVDDQLSTQQWRSEYFGDHYGRLSQLKAQVDPTNVFKFPQAILPPGQPSRRRVF